MLQLALSLIQPIAGWLVGAAGVVGLLFTVYMKGRTDVAKNAQIDSQQKVINDLKNRQATDNSVNALPDSDAGSMLSKWNRDGAPPAH